MAKPTYDELAELVVVQAELIKSLTAEVKLLRAEVVELKRRLDADSSNSSRPPSSDSPFTKKPAKARSSRQVTGRKPGKQPGDPGVSRSLSDHPDRIVHIDPVACADCHGSLTTATARMADRRQVVDLPPVASPMVTEYRLGAKTCCCCGTETIAEWTDNIDDNTEVLSTPGCRCGSGPSVGDVRVSDLRALPADRAGHHLDADVDRVAPGHRVHRPGPPASARVRLLRRGQGPAGTSFWVDVPGQIGDGPAHHLRFLLQQPYPLAGFAQLSGLGRGRSGRQPVGDVRPFHPVVHRGFRDPEVLRDLRPWDLSFPGEGDHVAAELVGVGLRHGVHLSSQDQILAQDQWSTKPWAVPTVPHRAVATPSPRTQLNSYMGPNQTATTGRSPRPRWSHFKPSPRGQIRLSGPQR